MEMSEVFVFDAGWIFFAAWGIVLAAVSVIAFGQDVVGLGYVEIEEAKSTD